MKKYIAYYRVSTKQQGNSGLGLEAQKTLVTNFLKSHNGELILPPFTEVESGTNEDRPELKKAVAKCKKTGSTLLIAKIDRLSRNIRFIFTLQDELKQAGVDFVACDLPEANTLTLGIMASMAQHENEIRSARQKAAFAEKRKRGEKMGSPQNLTDEARAKAHRSIAHKARTDEGTRHAWHFIKPRREAGQSYQAIADELNKEGYRTRKGKEFFPAQVQKLYRRFTEPDELLITVAKELNYVLGLDPQIKTDNTDQNQLMAKLQEATSLIDWENDPLSDETRKFRTENFLNRGQRQ